MPSIKASAPDLAPKLWYGMPAYAKDGKVICFFQPGEEVQGTLCDSRLQRSRQPRRGSMWPTAFALTELTATEEKRIEELVKRAVT